MPNFTFDPARSFEENWKALLAHMEGLDAEMAHILSANNEKIATIVSRGSRDPKIRADFNAAVVEALDRLIAAETQEARG